jgi:hypothetical protein
MENLIKEIVKLMPFKYDPHNPHRTEEYYSTITKNVILNLLLEMNRKNITIEEAINYLEN